MRLMAKLRLDLVDGVAEIDDGLNRVDAVAGIAHKVDIYRVISFPG